MVEDNANEFTVGSHPLLLVKTNVAWDGGIYSMVMAHCNLWWVSMQVKGETGWHMFCPG